ncbi:FecCD family ABC transporter permease [Paenibacillus pinihumi]|uniref:FecCD family ABC transporter permease n=1 Tax=Paenibacillus pinihumi TaxID=669462 RepID=UPI0012B58AFA|nr:iron ABC transporter permease [Paenibacillus pinihumi]
MAEQSARKGRMLTMLIAGAFLLLVSMLASILYGLRIFGLRDLWQAYSAFDGSTEHLILTNTRVPRTLIAAIVGASLAMAGAIMQVLTKNGLASPSLFGINSGASLFVVAALVMGGGAFALKQLIWFAFIGAAAAAVLVFALGSSGSRIEPSRLALAGASIAAFGTSMTSGLILVNKQSLDDALFWMIGSVSGRSLEHLELVLPYIGTGMLCCMLVARALNVMALGEENAMGLGMRMKYVQMVSAAAVILLAGSAVSVAGPIAFVGLVVPHLCRAVTGNDHRWLLPYCAVAGAILLVTADTLSRFIVPGKEIPVGIATAIIGVPFLIRVARRKKDA